METIWIPIKDEIPLISEEYHSIRSLRKQAFIERREDDLIVVPLDNRNRQELKDMLVYWVPQRREWIGIVYSTRGKDWYHNGPYTLDDFYALRILGAFGLPPERVISIIESDFSLRTVLKKSPEEISNIVRGINIAYREVSH